MREVRRHALVPQTPMQMYALVNDVARYPEFLPWCSGSAVLAATETGKTARLDINYHGVRAHFTTDNLNTPPASIVVTLKDGPFRHLHGEWTFRFLAPQACKVELALAYEFKTHLLETVVGPVFNHIAHTFIDAFVHRADAMHGKPS